MNTAGVLRRIKNLFGDDNNIVLHDDDMLDWINEAQLEIARETACRNASTTTAASNFIGGHNVADLLTVRGIKYGSTHLQPISFQELIRQSSLLTPTGTPDYFYMDGGDIFLYPEPSSGDSTTVTIRYVDYPTDLTTTGSSLDISAKYHNELVLYCLAKAHERNRDEGMANYYLEQFYSYLKTKPALEVPQKTPSKADS